MSRPIPFVLFFHASMKNRTFGFFDDTTDFSAFHAPEILETFEFRPIGLHSHVSAGP